MTIAVKLSEIHYKNFLIFNILKRLKLYKSPVIFASILTTSAIISFIMHRVQGAVFLGSVLLLVGLGVPIVYFTSFFSSLRKQVKQQNLNPPRLVYTLQLEKDSETFDITNEKEKATYRWEDVFHAYYEKDAIYLFITQERAFLLPFEVLEDPSEVFKFIEEKISAQRCTRGVT
ncbi:MAG: YcxB family protein [Spirochaetia bacterium]|nr:YcxB family protein [Spirochaetia bacterium]